MNSILKCVQHWLCCSFWQFFICIVFKYDIEDDSFIQNVFHTYFPMPSQPWMSLRPHALSLFHSDEEMRIKSLHFLFYIVLLWSFSVRCFFMNCRPSVIKKDTKGNKTHGYSFQRTRAHRLCDKFDTAALCIKWILPYSSSLKKKCNSSQM